MRFTPVTIALAAIVATVSSVGVGGRPDNQINPLSLQWQAKGDAARVAGQLGPATDAYESALAIDPRNRAAFVALGDVARTQGLQGKALRYYDGALALEPNDTAAIGGAVRALADRGAVSNAREWLARLRTACSGDCPQVAELSALIDRKSVAQAALATKDMAPPAPPAVPIARQP